MSQELKSLESLFGYNFNLGIVDSLKDSKIIDNISKYPRDYSVKSDGRTLSYVAFDIYGSVDYWMLLAIYNDIVDPFVVPEVIYYIPSSESYNLLR